MGHSMFLSGMVGYLDVENVGARVIACQWEFLVYDLDHVIIFPLIYTFCSISDNSLLVSYFHYFPSTVLKVVLKLSVTWWINDDIMRTSNKSKIKYEV